MLHLVEEDSATAADRVIRRASGKWKRGGLELMAHACKIIADRYAAPPACRVMGAIGSRSAEGAR